MNLRPAPLLSGAVVSSPRERERNKMSHQKDKTKRLLPILRRHNPEIDELCLDWERSQRKKGEEDEPIRICFQMPRV